MTRLEIELFCLKAKPRFRCLTSPGWLAGWLAGWRMDVRSRSKGGADPR